ncbi:MAG: electron transfer flavoprotein subunit beta/FixA family protein [Thermoplasmata archaeon]|nr:electron transfer flavoprotein subunit beta/FixA family protein [Thermoplasmata archaeon]
MDIIVCIKQVPDTTDVKIDPKTGTLVREGVPSIVNPDDKHAVEEAVRLKEKYGGKVTALTMGPPQATVALREVYAMGVDETVLLSDRAFAGADTWATAFALAKGIEKIGHYDIIFCGREAIDGDTAQIGPQLADSLGLPQVTYVRKVEKKEDKLVVERALEDSHVVLEVGMPCLLTVIKDLNDPRYPNMGRIVDAHRTHEIKTWSAADVGADPEKIGLNGSPTQVRKTFAPEPKGTGEMIEGESGQAKAKILIDRLKEKNVVRRSVS